MKRISLLVCYEDGRDLLDATVKCEEGRCHEECGWLMAEKEFGRNICSLFHVNLSKPNRCNSCVRVFGL